MEFLQNDSNTPHRNTRRMYKKRSKTYSFTPLSRNLIIEKPLERMVPTVFWHLVPLLVEISGIEPLTS